jgi:hypothetical protein
LRYAPLTQRYGDELVEQVLRGVRCRPSRQPTGVSS